VTAAKAGNIFPSCREIRSFIAVSRRKLVLNTPAVLCVLFLAHFPIEDFMLSACCLSLCIRPYQRFNV
jgi:hypothetical protein